MLFPHSASGIALTLILSVVLSGCGSNGHITEDDFPAHTDEEQEAKERIQYWVDNAATQKAHDCRKNRHRRGL